MAISHTRILDLVLAFDRQVASRRAFRDLLSQHLTSLREARISLREFLTALDALTAPTLTEQDLQDHFLVERERAAYVPGHARAKSEATRKREQRARHRARLEGELAQALGAEPAKHFNPLEPHGTIHTTDLMSRSLSLTPEELAAQMRANYAGAGEGEGESESDAF